MAQAKGKGRILVGVGIVVVVLCAAAFAFDRYALATTYARHEEPSVSLLPSYEMYERDYPRSDVQFELNGRVLRGHVYGQDNDRGLIIFRHGIFSQHEHYLPFITAMADKGWRVFAYDAIGCGDSDGDSALGMSQSPIDVAAAVDFARESGMAEGMRIGLWGHSWGGYGVAAALAKRPDDVSACVTMSGFDTPMKILDSSAASAYGLAGKAQWPFLWLNTAIDFGSDANLSASDAIVSSGVPTLVFHGTGDTTVPYEGVSILHALQQRDASLAQARISLTTLSQEGRCGHNDYFYGPESQAYLQECAADLEELLAQAGENPDDPAVRAYLEGVDLRRANTADPEIVATIDAFFGETLSQR